MKRIRGKIKDISRTFGKKNGKIQDFPGQSQKSRIIQDSGHHVSYFLHIINTVFRNHNSKFGEIWKKNCGSSHKNDKLRQKIMKANKHN